MMSKKVAGEQSTQREPRGENLRDPIRVYVRNLGEERLLES
jgi:hypothetical protein